MTAAAPASSLPSDLPPLRELPGSADRWALFLDLDGTLIDIAARPEEVVVPDDLLPSLSALSERLGGAVAIVTGRRLTDVDRLLGRIAMPVAGLHGAVLRVNGRVIEDAEAAVPAELMAALLQFVDARPGLLLEPKGPSVAVHFRSVPERGPEVEAKVSELVRALAPRHEIQPGKMVYEIKPLGANKGRAIAQLLEQEPFRGRLPAVFGDDLTDEAGFGVARQADGIATLVGDPARRTIATHHLASPSEVRAFLTRYAEGGGGWSSSRI